MSASIEEQLRSEGYFVSTTSGYSMYPMLRDRRDRVILRAVGKDELLGRGELPLYRRPDGKYVLHRVLSYKDGSYIIRGDNTYVKEIVPREWVIGVVTEFYRGEKQIKVSQKGYRFYRTVWQWIYPLRRAWIALRRLGSKIKRKLLGSK